MLAVSGADLPTKAAVPTPVQWTAAAAQKQPVAAGKVVTLTLAAHIEHGWHVYALDEPDGGPIATQIGLAEGDPLSLVDVSEPPPRMVQDPVLRQRVGMHQDTVVFSLRVRTPAKGVVAGAVSHILVRYQSCNEQVCLPPKTVTVALPLTGVVR